MFRPFVFSISCLVFMGCAVHEIQSDHDKIRSTLLDLYTNQIIDNLIRAQNGLPIVHIDYTSASAQVTVSQTASLSDALATTNSSVLTTAAVTMLAVTKTTLNTLTPTIGGTNSNQVTLAAQPLTTANEVYDAYLEFLTIPGSLQMSSTRPPPDLVHICKKCGKMYYWVPASYKKEFLALSLLTTVQRGKALLPPDEFYKVKLVKIVKSEPEVTQPGPWKLTVELDTSVPNDPGRMEFTVGGKTFYFQYQSSNPGDRVPQSQTKTLTFSCLPEDLKDLPGDLKTPAGLPLPLADAKLYFRHYRPTVPPTTSELLNRVNFQLQQIQLNQLRPSGK